jgi:hypothetical protein
MSEDWNGELMIGNQNTHKRDLHLRNGSESSEYALEKKCMETLDFETDNGIVGNGGK